ncbi:putative GPI-anchored protein [Senna tora]|uniref:Putative GPI-anchored protein n=1 Tax=Senna tora TaxID=362788 RepID=A0A834X2G5_9FABA|nr:putative GPI-anchored protein [Senna tora]
MVKIRNEAPSDILLVHNRNMLVAKKSIEDEDQARVQAGNTSRHYGSIPRVGNIQGCPLNWSAISSAKHSAFLFLVRVVKFMDARYLLIPWMIQKEKGRKKEQEKQRKLGKRHCWCVPWPCCFFKEKQSGRPMHYYNGKPPTSFPFVPARHASPFFAKSGQMSFLSKMASFPS